MGAPSKIQVTFYLVRADAINVVLMPPSRATRGAAAAAPFQEDVASEWLAEGDDGACDQEDLASEDLSFDHLSMISDSQSWVESAGDSQASDGSSSRPSKAARILLECDRDAYTRRESIALKRKVVDQASTIAELKCELKRLKASPNGHGLDSIVAGKHMTPATGLLLALKKGYTSCKQMSEIVGQKIDPNTVKRWEIKLQTTILAASQSFHRESEQLLVDDSTRQELNIRVAQHIVQHDATKSNLWQELKLNACRIISNYFLGRHIGGDGLVHHECWPDALKVLEGTGEATLNLVSKQLQAAGCCCYNVHMAVPEIPSLIRIVHSVGDCGSDCVWSRREVLLMFMVYKLVWNFSWPCLSHQQSLGCARILTRLDILSKRFGLPNGYYASLVKIINQFRHHHHVEDRLRKPGTCFSGRWNAVTNSEKFLVEEVGKERAQEKFRNGFKKKKTSGPAMGAVAAASIGCPLDDERIDAIQHHQEKLGRWEREGKAAILDERWWELNELSQTAKLPFDMVINFLQTPLRKLREKYGQSATHLSVLVCKKGPMIFAEYGKLMGKPEWDERRPEFIEAFTQIMWFSEGEFRFRFTERLEAWPYLIMYLVESPPEQKCPVRQRYVTQLVFAPNRKLDVGTAKMRYCFWGQLLDSMKDGTLHVEVYDVLCTWKRDLPCDMQLIESGNSILNRMALLSPNLGEVLVACRFTTRQDLNIVRQNQPNKVSQALQLALDNFKSSDYKALENHDGRWSSAYDSSTWFPLRRPAVLALGPAVPTPAAPSILPYALPIADAKPGDMPDEPGVPDVAKASELGGADGASVPSESDGAAAAAAGEAEAEEAVDGKPGSRPPADWCMCCPEVGTMLPDDVTLESLHMADSWHSKFMSSFSGISDVKQCVVITSDADSRALTLGAIAWVCPCALSRVSHMVRLECTRICRH